MENTTYIAISRQLGLRRSMDIVAHNIANANTSAFKAERMVCQEYLVKPEATEELAFAQDIGTARDLSAGPLTRTDNDLDIAITDESSYFVVETPLGERYTRHGHFQLDPDGRLVTGEGRPVQGRNGPINLPTGDNASGKIAIAADGTISDGDTVIDRLRLVTFQNQQQLRKAANGLFIAGEDQKPQDAENPTVAQGMIEGSNVKPILELTRMMRINRTHESVTRFLRREDERIKDMINRLAKQTTA